MRLRWLDLYCCQGGAAVGLARAGGLVHGVDNNHRHRRYYPFVFTHDEAVDYLLRHRRDYDAIWASPPCQFGTRGNAGKTTAHVNLIPETREALRSTGLPYVIENVEHVAPHLHDPVMLCGSMFNLSTADEDGQLLALTRHRLFETNWPLAVPEHPDHASLKGWIAGVYGGARGRRPGQTAAEHRHEARYVRKGGYVPRDPAVRRALLGIDWPTTNKALEECIPPAYSEWIGHQLVTHLEG